MGTSLDVSTTTSRTQTFAALALAFGLGVLSYNRLKPYLYKIQSVCCKTISCAEKEVANKSHEQHLTFRPARIVAPPSPSWVPGDKQPSPFPDFDERITMDPAQMTNMELYVLSISAVVPRPIALISSIDSNGVRNLAPFSYFNIMGHNPTYISVGILKRAGVKKDTLANIEATGEFVVNIMSEWFVNAAHHTCGDYAPEMDEWEISGLTPLLSEEVAPSRVKESAVHLECKLRHVYETRDRAGVHASSIVIAEVVKFHVSRAVIAAAGKDGAGPVTVDPVLLAPVSRMGGNTYAGVRELYDIPRPDKYGNYPTVA